VKIAFRDSFAKDLALLTDQTLLRRVREVIERIDQARGFQEIPNLKRLETKGKYYRVRVGEYRLGLVFENGALTFVRCLDRKAIYRFFP
jgi:mRNA interferase RelE/StbE